MRIVIGSVIKIYDYNGSVEKWCTDNLIVKNPTYETLKKLGKEDTIKRKHVPEKLKNFVRRGSTIELPFGCLYGIWPLIKDEEIELKFNNNPKISIADKECPVELFDYQQKAVDYMIPAKGGVLVSPCGSGKGLPLDAKIYTPNGWKYNGDLQVGDSIIGSNGKEIKVTGIYDKGLVDAYKITFSDDTTIICDKDHLWSAQKTWQRKDGKGYDTWKTEDIYNHYHNNFRRGQELYIPIVEPVEFQKQKINIDPWLLGFLIGDGCLCYNRVTFTNSEEDLVEKVKNSTKDKVNKLKEKYAYSLTGCNTLFEMRCLELSEKHSYEKFIPKEYKYNDIQTRLKVLQGLFDSDGTVENNCSFTYLTSSKQLAEDFLEIVQSLGGTGKIKEKHKTYTYNGVKKEGRTSYLIQFKLYDFKPFTSLKHKNKFKERTKYIKAYRIIKKIEKTKPITSRCITVDAKDELYVTDNFIVTHNTFMGIEMIRRIGKKFLWLTHTGDLLRQTYAEFKNLYPNIDIGLITEGKLEFGKDGCIATVQTLCKIDPMKYRDEFDVIVVDECAHCVSTPDATKMFSKIMENVPARYKYGLTATPSRSDSLIETMYGLIGLSKEGKFDATYKIDKKEIKTIPAQHEKVALNTYIDPESDVFEIDGTIIFNNLINYLSFDEKRNKIILDNIEECHKQNRKQVVLVLRVEHAQLLHEALKARGLRSVCATGKTKKSDREKFLCTNTEDWDILVSTYALLKEGINIKTLDTLHLTVPQKDKALIVQCVGRIERFVENKKQPIAYDYVDQNVSYCLNAFYSRQRSIRNRY